MTCEDVKLGVFVYLDGEYAAPEAEAFKRHLDECHSCRDFAKGEAAFLGDLKASLPEPALPSGMEARLLSALNESGDVHAPAEGSASRLVQWLMPPLALAAGALLTFGAWDLLGLSMPSEATVRHAVAAHQTAMPPEVVGSEANVRQFVRENAPFAADVPLKPGEGLTLVGARLTQVDGRVAVIYQYDKAGQRVSVLQAVSESGGVSSAEANSRLEHSQGYGVLTFGSRGLNNSVVGQLPEIEMRDLVPVSFKP